MSDEFISVATKEVNSDIESLENIYKLCSNDFDVFQNSSKLQKHTHKIKGLAPMMGKESLGDVSASLDDLFKKMIDGSHYDGIFDLLSQSILAMKKSMTVPNFDFSQINNKIKQL
ncbi:Hpt domain-containing protein [Nitrosopumilus sp.]|uniref:Hpt domain-containing protein n=1 Tax=Nitrosopumilus sp. TaxID=2024843 RepID=UPI00247ED0AB|nr:Hpt domain-containing protein [Nitrosopumilus sp.]MCV0430321.1 Hpt domain-containing protein [Nitrosopumilus sp.]